MSATYQSLARFWGGLVQKVQSNAVVGAAFWRLPPNARRLIARACRVGRDVPEPIVDEILKRKVLFIHVPKTAGVSLQHTLFGQMVFGHQAYQQYELIFSRRLLNSLFKFTFVRNPWDRLASAWIYFRDIGKGTLPPGRPPAPGAAMWFAENIAQFSDFESFVRGWVSKANVDRAFPHFKTQASFLRDRHGRIEFDFVGRFERLAEDFEQVSRMIGSAGALENRNRTVSRESASYRQYYTPETADMAGRAYREDVRTFGYEF
jgi:hypothetical protein